MWQEAFTEFLKALTHLAELLGELIEKELEDE